MDRFVAALLAMTGDAGGSPGVPGLAAPPSPAT
jgi:hypothetical protein